MNYADAKARCESDGTFLVIPRSEAENIFIAGLIKDDNFWIGINDIEQEGNFIAVDGGDLPYTNWHNHETFNEKKEGVEIRWWDYGHWNNVAVSEQQKFICSISIKGKFISSVWNSVNDAAF